MVFHATSFEHFLKLQRVAKRLHDSEIHADDIDDFCKTAWHLIELAQKDGSREQRRRASKLRSDPEIILCEHAANVSKHGTSRPQVERDSAIQAVKIKRGYGVGRFGRGGYGVGEQSILFEFKDGSERDAIDFVSSVLEKWEAVFSSTDDPD